MIAVLPRASVSAVNLAEVVGKLAEVGGSADRIDLAIRELHLKITPFDGEQARQAGLMRPATKLLGLSLGDRACLSLAFRLNAIAMTTDKVWNLIPADLGVRVEVVR